MRISKNQSSNSGFLRSVYVLVSGTVASQMILLLAAPLLTRLYSPQDFGLLAVFIAFLMFMSAVVSLRYEQAIPLPEDARAGAALLVLSMAMAVLVATLLALPTMWYAKEIAARLNVPGFAEYMFLVPAGALLIGFYNVLSQWAIRTRQFGPLARTRVSQSFLAIAIQLFGAPLGPVALLIGQVAGHGAGSVSLYLQGVSKHRPLLRSVGRRDLAQAAKRYRRFPLYASWGAMFNTIGSQLPPLLFAALFSPALAGTYALANRVLSMPMQVVGKAIANVFLAGAADARREGRLGVFVARVHGKLSHIGMVPTLMLLMAGPEIFAFAFGIQWREAGVFAQWLAPWLYLVFVTSPMSAVLDVLDRQAAAMAFQALLLAVRIAAILSGAWLGDARLAIALFGMGSALCWLAQLAWIIRAADAHWRSMAMASAAALAWGMTIVSPLIVTLYWDIERVGQIDTAVWLMALALAGLLAIGRFTFLLKNAWS
ncbi:lipopolysaccharide biosynthesis protein [Noviherbaspirillum sp. Root189]|uniref:lipopolysaccharide biosynthesis protein n=1 Tax=Noviherbaspirillum sp. Root189 TaxID=1736487 RepID=UPI00070917FC|nr:oligosaccharide flippase family protein [Noviherbaspirillum sp. Root189]